MTCTTCGATRPQANLILDGGQARCPEHVYALAQQQIISPPHSRPARPAHGLTVVDVPRSFRFVIVAEQRERVVIKRQRG